MDEKNNISADELLDSVTEVEMELKDHRADDDFERMLAELNGETYIPRPRPEPEPMEETAAEPETEPETAPEEAPVAETAETAQETSEKTSEEAETTAREFPKPLEQTTEYEPVFDGLTSALSENGTPLPPEET